MVKETKRQEKEIVGLVFIQGAGLGKELWGTVVSEMENPFLLIDFPKREDKMRNNLTLQEYSVYIKQQIEAWGVEKIVLVAHSLGGVLAIKTAKDLSNCLVGFIAIGATIPTDGGSFLSTFPLAKRLLMTVMLNIFGTRPPDSAIRKGLCNDLSYEQANEVVNGFVPESIHVYTERTEASLPSNLPKLYIKLAKDQEMSVAQQDKMIANLAPQKIEILETGHLPMISNPDGLRQSLNAFLSRWDLH